MARHIEVWKVDNKYHVEADTETGTETLMVLNDLSELEQLMHQVNGMIDHEIQSSWLIPKCPD